MYKKIALINQLGELVAYSYSFGAKSGEKVSEGYAKKDGGYIYKGFNTLKVSKAKKWFKERYRGTPFVAEVDHTPNYRVFVWGMEITFTENNDT